MKLTYAVVIGQSPNNYVAYAPEVPDCISTAKTWDEMLAMIREALIVHIEFLIEDDDLIPESMMSIDDDIAYHRKELAKADEKLLAGYVNIPPTISTTFRMAEIEVPVLPLGTV
ncbi:MAG: type II toxin-antitoxin system HicB family antitoxin [Caldilineaceae bacterium SB0662_bin_9]|uniref:Type II toxin-antitoxin system HicB family antitoxin n=1 Tax=Caldilineaceae bacterium SB0662_bin_9 TaxID=2605258 RepID=A0A6B1DTJ5_9CHLR|nr:type II toxin-antitoxin system HicB family antitoxin [Caldilineaceae bacterium]MYD90115.1 type II toxin-antitoxin system HicB family antitoxin [Caldilineaceae bacterium SB0662_bin_9]